MAEDTLREGLDQLGLSILSIDAEKVQEFINVCKAMEVQRLVIHTVFAVKVEGRKEAVVASEIGCLLPKAEEDSNNVIIFGVVALKQQSEVREQVDAALNENPGTPSQENSLGSIPWASVLSLAEISPEQDAEVLCRIEDAREQIEELFTETLTIEMLLDSAFSGRFDATGNDGMHAGGIVFEPGHTEFLNHFLPGLGTPGCFGNAAIAFDNDTELVEEGSVHDDEFPTHSSSGLTGIEFDVISDSEME